MTVFVDVEPRLDDDATGALAAEVRQAVTDGIRDALEGLTFALALTPDEREAVHRYRNKQAAAVRRARAHIARSANGSQS